MTTKKYLYISAIVSIFIIHSCNKTEKIENDDKPEEVSSSEIPVSSSETAHTSDKSVSISETASTDTENVDKLLDDYEKYADRYLSYIKRAKTGDQKAIEEYPAIMEKGKALEKSMTASKNDKAWNVKQMKRMKAIETKMIIASADI